MGVPGACGSVSSPGDLLLGRRDLQEDCSSCCLIFQCAEGFADASICFPKLFAEDKIFHSGSFLCRAKRHSHSVESNWHSVKIEQSCF